MKKIPRAFKKFDKMDDNDFILYIWNTYSYNTYKDGKVYVVKTYFGRTLIKSESKKMIVYWLEFERNIKECRKI